MIMKANKQIGFIYKNEESIDKILKDGDVVFERGFLREKTSTTLPITFGGVGKDLKDYKIYGNTYQNSTSGKNLYGISDYSNTTNGVEVIIKDGMITLNGTCTSTTTLVLNSKDEQKLNGNYNISLNRISGTYTGTSNINLRHYNDETVINGTQINFNLLNNQFSLVNEKIKYGIYFVKNAVFDNFKFRPQLVVGTEPDYDYEPYTGGQSSPNPDYPQEIISCGDRTKNLFDKNNTTKLNGTISASYNRFEGGGSNYCIVIPCKSNTTYTVEKRNDGNTNRFALASSETLPSSTPGESTPLLNKIRGDASSNLSLTTGSTANYLIVQYYRTAESVLTEQQILDSIQIEEASTATSYEPYGYKIPVNVRSDNLSYNFRKIWYSTNSGLFYTANNFKSCMAKVKPNTEYTISKKNASNRFVVITSKNEIVPSVAYKRIIIVEQNSNRTQYTFTTQADENYLFFGYYSGTDETEIELAEAEIMIVEGSTAPSKYIPYYNETTNIYLDEPLRKTKDGTYVDYIDFINQKVVRRIKETLLDDNITWITGRFANEKRIYTSSSNIDSNMRAVTSNSQVGYLLSNQYKAEKLENILDLSVRYGIGISSTSYFSILNQDYASATDLLQALHDNPIVLDYVLRTPTEEDIELPNIPTLDGNNTLNIETEITPSQVYIKYKSNS